MSGYVVDGKGNVYAAETGTLVWSGDPADVLTLLMQLDQLRAENARLLRLVAIGKEAAQHGLVLAMEHEALRDELRNANAHR